MFSCLKCENIFSCLKESPLFLIRKIQNLGSYPYKPDEDIAEPIIPPHVRHNDGLSDDEHADPNRFRNAKLEGKKDQEKGDIGLQ
jgi:hypothetical protein